MKKYRIVRTGRGYEAYKNQFYVILIEDRENIETELKKVEMETFREFLKNVTPISFLVCTLERKLKNCQFSLGINIEDNYYYHWKFEDTPEFLTNYVELSWWSDLFYENLPDIEGVKYIEEEHKDYRGKLIKETKGIVFEAENNSEAVKKFKEITERIAPIHEKHFK